MLRLLIVALVIAGTVLATDIFFRSTLLHTLWPKILAPADGAIVTPPLTLTWKGPRTTITLINSGLRQELGEHDSPFEIPTELFPRQGQYTVEMTSPVLGTWSQTQRRFLVQLPAPKTARSHAPQDYEAEIASLQDKIARLEAERGQALEQAASLRESNQSLQAENNDLASGVNELHAVQEQVDAMQQLLDEQREDSQQQQQALAEENRLLKNQIESVPPCTAWGYLTYPRPQTLPATRRVVVVSDNRGIIFQNQVQCEITRRVDRGAASPCVCIGQTWGR